MREAFAFNFDPEVKTKAYNLIKLDANIWGPDCEEGTFTTPGGVTGKSQKIYIDERSEEEYKNFSKYFQ
jgi:hypothetical protein